MDFTNLYRVVGLGEDADGKTFIRARSLAEAAKIKERDGYGGEGIVFVGYIRKDDDE